MIHLRSALELIDDLEIELDGLPGLVLQLELASLVFELVNV